MRAHVRISVLSSHSLPLYALLFPFLSFFCRCFHTRSFKVQLNSRTLTRKGLWHNKISRCISKKWKLPSKKGKTPVIQKGGFGPYGSNANCCHPEDKTKMGTLVGRTLRHWKGLFQWNICFDNQRWWKNNPSHQCKILEKRLKKKEKKERKPGSSQLNKVLLAPAYFRFRFLIEFEGGKGLGLGRTHSDFWVETQGRTETRRWVE